MTKVRLILMMLLIFAGSLAAQVSGLWEKLPGDFSWFQVDGNTRGMAYNPATDHVLVASRTGGSVIYILDAATGDSLGALNMTGVAGGTFAINIPRVDANGVIYVGNLSLAGGTFKIYRWENEAAAPTVAFEGTVALRTGDSFALSGSGTATVLYASGSSSTEITRFTSTDGISYTVDTAVPVAAGLARGGISPVPAASVNDFWVNGSGTPVSHVDLAGNVVSQMNPTVVSSSWYNVHYIPGNALLNLVAVVGNSGADIGRQIQLWDVTASETDPVQYGVGELSGAWNGNANATGDIAYKNNGDNTLTVFQLVTQNGIAAYTVTLPDLTPPQVVINEIHYNGPEVGTDTTEFIELYNLEANPVDLSGFSFTAGVTFTFPAGATIAAGGYMVTAFDTSAFRNYYGYSADYQWATGGLSNSGELIKLAMAGTITVDSVLFDDVAPWPVEPDGSGPSLELIDPALDNSLAESWQASLVVGGTPGLPNSAPSDTITQNWEKNVGDYTWFANDNNTRGFAYNPATDHLLVASRTGGSVVYIVDAADGSELGTLDMTGVSGGTFAINIPRVDANGVIYLANLTLANGTFKIYRWENETAVPTVAFEGILPERTGDSFGLRGSGAGTILYASGSGSLNVYRFTTTDGVTYTQDTGIPVATGLARGGISPVEEGVVERVSVEDLWVNGTGTATSHIDGSGTVINAIDPTVVSSSWYNVGYKAAAGGYKYVAVVGNAGQDIGRQIQMWDITNSETNPVPYAIGELTNVWNANANAAGDVAFRDNGDNTVTMFQLVTNNGIASWQVVLPDEPLPLQLTIAQIQNTGGGPGPSPYEGQIVETSGIVTGRNSNGYFLQDGAGAWSGIYVFDNSNTAQVGDDVTIIGTVTEFSGLTEITTITSFTVNSQGNALPDFAVVTSGDFNQEQYEGVLVKVENATVTDPDLGFGEWQIDDGSGPARVDDLLFGFAPDSGAVYSVSGPGYYSFGAYKILPRDSSDVVPGAPPSKIANIWEKNVGDYTWFANDNNTRGFAYNPATNHLLVASRSGGSIVHIVDAADGADLGALDMTGVSGGTFAINIPRVDANGVIYLANLTLANGTFKIYRWENETAVPTVAFEGILPERTGDSFGLRGSGAGTILYASGSGSLNVYRFTTTDGVTYTQDTGIPVATGLARGGISPIEEGIVERVSVEDLWVNGTGTATSHIDGSGTVINAINPTVVSSSWYNVGYLAANSGDKYVAVVGNAGQDVGRQIQIWDITASETDPLEYAIGELTNTWNANANAAGDVAYRKNGDTTITVFQLVTNNGIAAWELDVPDVTGPPVVTIKDIQETADGGPGPSPLAGQIVQTNGIVYGAYTDGFFMHDAAGPWNGVFVFNPAHGLSVGDDITLVASVTEYFDMTELNNVSSITVNSSGNTPYDPTVVTSGDYPQEQYEGVLVTVENAVATNPDLGFGEWEIDDGSGPARVDDLMLSFVPDSGAVYTVTGGGYYSFNNYKIQPRDSSDVVQGVVYPIAGLWEKNVGDYTWFGNDNATRGIAYNPATNHLLVASRTGGSVIYIVDAADGAELGSLDMTGVAGGTYAINIVRADANGVIYVGNLALANGTYKIYRWENESAAPTVAYEGVMTNRTGDSFGLYGSGTGTILYASGSTNTEVHRFTTSDGINFTLDTGVPVASGLARGGISPIPESLGAEMWVNGTGSPTSHIDDAGTVISQMNTGVVSSSWYNALYMPAGATKLVAMVGNPGADIGQQIQVWDVTDSETDPVPYAIASLTNVWNPNANAAGDAAYKNNGDGTYTVFQLVTNNGIAAYVMDVPTAPLAVYSTTELVFDEIAVGASQTLSFTLSNLGSGDLTVNSVSFQGTAFSTSLVGGEVLAPDSVLEVLVSFIPDSAATYGDTMLVATNAGTQGIALSGSAFELWPVDWRVLADTASWFGTTNSVRSLAYSKATRHLYIPSRVGGNFVKVLDAQSGALLPDLDMTGFVGGGLIHLNMAGATADGQIFAANVAQGSDFILYRWENENAQLSLAFSGTLDGRVGDVIDVSGSGSDVEVFVSGTGNDKVFVLSTTDGVNFAVTDTIPLPEADAARLGLSRVGESDYFFINAPAKAPRYIKRDGTVLHEFDTAVLAGVSIEYFEIDTKDDTTRRFIGVSNGFSPGTRVVELLGQPGDSLASSFAVQAANTPMYLTNPNGNATVQLAYDPFNNALVELVTNNGLTSYSFEVVVPNDTVLVGIELADNAVPASYHLGQNYPNPFNPTTTIELALPQVADVTVTVYNVLGQRVGTIYKGKLQAGSHKLTFDGARLASGVYFYHVKANDYQKVKKMVLMK